MIDPLYDLAAKLKQRIRDHEQTLASNEYRTRVSLIDPVLQMLGWDVADPDLVTLEYETLAAHRVDYALLPAPGSAPVALLEAKRLGESLDNHTNQALGYSVQSGVSYVGITNGDRWILYDALQAAPLDDRVLMNVSLSQTPLPAFCLHMLALWRPNVSAPLLTQPLTPLATVQNEAEPAETLPAQPAPADRGWIGLSLDDLRPGNQAPPPKVIRFPDGAEYAMSAWRHIIVKTAQWLVETGRIDRASLPASQIGTKRLLTSVVPQEDRRHYEEIAAGAYVYVNLSGANSIRGARQLMIDAGQPVDAIRVFPE